MSRDIRYTYQYRIRCDVTRLNLPGHVIAVGTPAIRHIHVKSKLLLIHENSICKAVSEDRAGCLGRGFR